MPFYRTAISIFVAIFFWAMKMIVSHWKARKSSFVKLKNSTPYLSEWIDVNSTIKKYPQIDAEVQRILALMTLEEKVGQMIQPDIRVVTPEDAKEYKLG